MLSIEGLYGRMGKISNNIEKHGDEDVSEFNIPITGIMLTKEQLNAFLEDPYADRGMYNKKSDLVEPMPWTKKVSISLDDRYEGASATIEVSGERQLEFENVRLAKISIQPQMGGLTQVDLQLQVLPGLGQTNLLLQEHQNREIKLTVLDAKVALKKGSKQQDLPLNTVGDNEQPDEKPEEPTHPEQLFNKPKRGRKAKKGGEQPSAH